MLDTGVRVSEAAGICLADMDLNHGLVLIRGRDRRSARYRSPRGLSHRFDLGWSFAARGGNAFWITDHGIQVLFLRIAKEAGVPVTPYVFRHEAATHK
jgi:site-specific recombinase XerD